MRESKEIFKEGDIVVCIEDKYISSDINNGIIKIGNKYTVSAVLDSIDGKFIAFENFNHFIRSTSFMSINKYRLLKINTIINEIKNN